jgi:hypothetical protein
MDLSPALARQVELGVFLDPNPASPALIRDYEILVGRRIGSVQWYQAWDATTQPGFPAATLNAILNHEGYDADMKLLMTWQPMVSLDALNAGAYDAYLARYAAQMRAWGRVIRLRFAHEMIQDNHYDGCFGQPGCGEWYPWQDQPAAYARAFRHVRDIFSVAGARNVKFVWCPNAFPYQPEILQAYYPGADYVDWLCIDGYNWTNADNQSGWPDWQWFDAVFGKMYSTFVNNLDIFGNRPILLGEIGSCEAGPYEIAGQTKATWISDALARLKTQDYAKIKAMFWFNTIKECDWRVETSPASLAAFRAGIANPIFTSHRNPSLYMPIVRG